MRVAILGGTFDPVHNGHIVAARSVAQAFDTHEVRFVPAYAAPHKPSDHTTSAFHRFAMVALAIAPYGDFRVSPIEVDSLEKRYTVDTIAQMRESTPDAQFVFVMGTDMYRDFELWKDYRRLFTLTHIAVVNRPGFEFRTDLAAHRVVNAGETVALPTGPSVFYLPFVDEPVSSTALRDALRQSADVRQLIPDAVGNYIRAHNLYS